MNYDTMIKLLADRGIHILNDVDELLGMWGCDLKTRTPRTYPGEDGELITSLDLATLMMTLATTQAVINLPRYRASLPTRVREGEFLVSNENRHGHVYGVSSHQKVASMGILFKDLNVVGQDQVGAWRTVNFVGADGVIRDEDAWKQIEIFGMDGSLTDSIEVTQPVAGTRWSSIYGRPYLIAKAATLRLADQVSHLKRTVSKLRDAAGIEPTSYSRSFTTGEQSSVQVEAFEAEIDGFGLHGQYPQVTELDDAERHLQRANAQLKTLRFMTRVSELAFKQTAVAPHTVDGASATAWTSGKAEGRPLEPAWATRGAWVTGYKEGPRKRKLWARREARLGMHVRFRCWPQTHKVSLDEANTIKQHSSNNT
jgi:hypothetical protein